MDIYTSPETKSFVDEFVNMDRKVPDIALLSLLKSCKIAKGTVEKQAYKELLTCYALGAVVPNISATHGIKWDLSLVS